MRANIFSFCYRFTRFIVTKTLYFFQAILFKPKDLEPAVKLGDSVLSTISFVGTPFFNFPLPTYQDVEVFDLIFPSPLIGSSFKSETSILNIWLKMGLGGLIFKTILKNPRNGNEQPRLQDAYLDGEPGLLNSMGLPGPGIDSFAQAITQSKLWKYNRPLGISIGGDSYKEYIQNIAKIQDAMLPTSFPFFYEINISCPNTENGGTLGENPKLLNGLLTEIRQGNSTPISVKVSPELSDEKLKQIGDLCRKHEKIFINAGNTHYKKPSEVGIYPNDFSMIGGGFSGPSLFLRTLEMVKIFSEFKIPILATGGISTIHHINAAKQNGAVLFGMATALVLDPYCVPKINSQL
ncbi:MAG: hypothetical protein HOE56_00595 [Candidatus Marinimicrobia bacterium]|nr:hypothetical protein [Candidatus Neomarinimicrobiota bacterium]MBT4752620.1 hypothetical protein [Candidatus Neomarinimicrobiota bacterium]MBT6796321.1 hypothetical protein [Candidatus Neomarinimicrobiota bacterium]